MNGTGADGFLPDGSISPQVSNGDNNHHHVPISIEVTDTLAEDDFEFTVNAEQMVAEFAGEETISLASSDSSQTPREIDPLTAKKRTSHNKYLHKLIQKARATRVKPLTIEIPKEDQYSIVNTAYLADDTYISRVTKAAVNEAKLTLSPTGTLLNPDGTFFATHGSTITIIANLVLDPQSSAEQTAKLNDLSDAIAAILKSNPKILQHKIVFPFNDIIVGHWCLVEIAFSTTTGIEHGGTEVKTHIDQLNYLRVYDSLQAVPSDKKIRDILDPLLGKYMFDPEDLRYGIGLVPVKHQNDGSTCGIIVAQWILELIKKGRIEFGSGTFTAKEKLDMRLQQLMLVNDPDFTKAQKENRANHRCSNKVEASDTIKHLHEVLVAYLNKLEPSEKEEFENFAKQFLISDLALTKLNISAMVQFGYDPDQLDICIIKLRALKIDPDNIAAGAKLDQDDRDNTNNLRNWFLLHKDALQEEGILHGFFDLLGKNETNPETKEIKTVPYLKWRMQKSLTDDVRKINAAELPFEFKDGRECLVEVLTRSYLPDEKQISLELEEVKRLREAAKPSKRPNNGYVDPDDYREDIRIESEEYVDVRAEEPRIQQHIPNGQVTFAPTTVIRIDNPKYFLQATAVGQTIAGAAKEVMLVGDERIDYVGEFDGLKKVGIGIETRFNRELGVELLAMGQRNHNGIFIEGTIKCLLGPELVIASDIYYLYCAGNISTGQLDGAVNLSLLKFSIGTQTSPINVGIFEFTKGELKLPASCSDQISTRVFQAIINHCRMYRGDFKFTGFNNLMDQRNQQMIRNRYLEEFFSQNSAELARVAQINKEKAELEDAAAKLLLFNKISTVQVPPVQSVDSSESKPRLKRARTF